MNISNIAIAGEGSVISTTVSKLRRLSKYLKIPISVFFMDEKPLFPDFPEDFRSRGSKEFTKNTVNAIRSVYWFQEILQEIYEVRDQWNVYFSLEDNPVEVGQLIAEKIGFEELRKKSRDSSELLRNIRYRLEDFNIFVFKASFPTEETRGFSISKEEPPIIVINNSEQSAGGKVFTVLHELGHIVLNKPGISEPGIFDSQNPIEKWCDEFAGTINLPQGLLADAEIDRSRDLGSVINEIAKRYKVSKASTAFTLMKAGKIKKIEFYEFLRRPYSTGESKDQGEFRIPRKTMIISQKGRKFTELVISACRMGQLPESDVRTILEINNHDKALLDLLEEF